MNYEVGDIVKINKQATIEDMTKNFWSGCQYTTLEFLRNCAYKDKTFIVIKINGNSVDLQETENCRVYQLVNKNILKKH